MPQTVKVVTDSTADIPEAKRKALGIEVVPLKVHFGEETFLDGITLKPAEFYNRLRETEQLPTTSQPSPDAFADTYRTILKEGKYDILSIHLSAALSGTYQSAVLGKSMVEEDVPDVSIEVVDSKLASYAFGMMVTVVAEAAKSGKTLDECRRLAERYIEEARVYFVVDTLKYLQKGGRIGKAAALVGSLLNIKPVLKLDKDGEVAPVEKVRGKRRAIERILDKLDAYAGGEPVRVSVLHADVPEEAEKLQSLLTERLHVVQMETGEIGPVIGTHAGHGTIGLVAVKESAVNIEQIK